MKTYFFITAFFIFFIFISQVTFAQSSTDQLMEAIQENNVEAVKKY